MADFAKFADPDQNWFAFLKAKREQQKVTKRMLQYFDGAISCKRKNQFDGNFGLKKKENVAGSSSAIFLNRVSLTLDQNWKPEMQQQSIFFNKKGGMQ